MAVLLRCSLKLPPDCREFQRGQEWFRCGLGLGFVVLSLLRWRLVRLFRAPPHSPRTNAASNTGSRPVTSGRLRSEEHTSELQSLMRISYAVFCWKKKKTIII